MEWKRIISIVVGLPIILSLLIFGNVYLVDIAVSIAAIICMHEIFKSFESIAKPIKWIGYVFAVALAFIHIIPSMFIVEVGTTMLIIGIAVMFMQAILQKMKHSVNDIAITIFCIIYIAGFLSFISLIRGLENGKIFLWIAFIIPWLTDSFAYLVGRKIGKHKMGEISPKKSWEGAIAGVIGAVISMAVYVAIVNKFCGLNLSWLILLPTVLLGIISQVGDLAASSIKRFVGIKDFGKLMPGHGGLLDRIDSVIFCAPFLYLILLIFRGQL